jgi:hypothetical protein
MNEAEVETVGKVFFVIGRRRRCLICDDIFTPMQAAKHAVTICHPSSTDSEGQRYT